MWENLSNNPLCFIPALLVLAFGVYAVYQLWKAHNLVNDILERTADENQTKSESN